MKYYICYAKEDQKQAALIKDLLPPQSALFVDLSEMPYTSDLLDEMKSKIDECDMLIALHSYAFKYSSLCRVQLVYASKKVEKICCLPIDSASLDKSLISEFKTGFYTNSKSFSESIKQLISNS